MKKIIIINILFVLSFCNLFANDSMLKKMIPSKYNINFLKGFVSNHSEKTPEYDLLTGTIKNKNISILKYKDKKKGIDILLDNFVLKDVFPLLKDISVLNSVSIKKLSLISDEKITSIDVNNKELKIIKSKKNKDSVFILFDNLASSSFIPYTKGTLLDNLSLNDVIFVVQKKNTKLKYNNISKYVQNKINTKNKNFEFEEGLNLVSMLDVKTSSGFKNLLNTLEIKETSFPLQGSLSKETFKSFSFPKINKDKNGKTKKNKKEKKVKLKDKEKKSILSSMSLNISLPKLKFKGFDKVLSSKSSSNMNIGSSEKKKRSKFNVSSLKFSSSESKNKSTSSNPLAISLDFPLNINLKGFTQELDSSISFTTGDSKSLSIISLLDKQWKSPLDMKNLNIKQGAFKIDLSSSKNMSLDFLGKADFKKLKNTNVEIVFKKSNSNFAIDKINLKNDFKLSSLLEGSYFKFFDKFVINNVSRSEDELFISGHQHGKKITFTKHKDKDEVEVNLEDFTVSDIFKKASKIPKLNSIALETLIINKKTVEAHILINNKLVKIIKDKNSKADDALAIYFSSVKSSTFVPKLSSSFVDKLSLNNVLFLLSKKEHSVKISDLPGTLSDDMKTYASSSIKLLEGINILANIDLKTSTELADVLKEFGIKSTTLPLQGRLSKDTFKLFSFSSVKKTKKDKKENKANASSSEKKSILRDMSFRITLPQIKFKKFDKFLSSDSSSTMRIENQEQNKNNKFFTKKMSFPSFNKSKEKSSSKKSNPLAINIDFPLNLKLNGFSQKLDSSLSFNSGDKKSISIISFMDKGWKNPLDVKSLNIKQGAFKIDLSASKDIEIDFLGTADFKKLKNTGVDISFSRSDSKFSIDKIDLTNNFKLSSLLDGNYFKYFDKFEINNVSRTKEELFISGHINGKEVSFTKHKDKNEVIIKLQDFVVSDLFSQAASIPKLNDFALDELIMKDKTIEAHLLINKKIVKIIKNKDSTADDALAIYFSSIKSSMFIPSSSASLADKLSLDNVLFLLSNKEHTLSISDLPGSLSEDMKSYPNSSIQLLNGINIIANLNLKTSSEVAETLSFFGVKSTSLPLKGTISKDSFKLFSFSSSAKKKSKKEKNSKKEDKSKVTKKEKASMLSSLSLSIALPKISIPKFDTAFDIKGPSSFNINGSSNSDPFWSSYNSNSKSKTETSVSNDKEVENKGSSGLSFSIDMNLNFKALSLKEAMPSKISFSGGKDKSISLVSLKDTKWENPFNIPGININTGAFVLDLHKDSPSDIEFFGFSDFASKKDIFMALDLSFDSGKISLKHLELDGNFSLNDFPSGNKIPFANKFSLSKVKFTTSGIEAKTLFSGINSDVFLFDTKEGSNFAISQDRFSFASILEGTKNIPLLNKINLSDVGVIFSENGMKLKSGNLPSIAQDMLDKTFKGLSSEVSIPKGISLLTKFSPSAFGEIGKGLKGLGVGDNSILVGELQGVFGGESAFNLDIIMDKRNVSSGLPNKILHLPEDAIAHYFINFKNKEIDVGIDIGIKVVVGSDKLIFDSEFELDFTPKGVGTSVLGKMDGTWHNPFGINGLSLSDVTLQVGITPLGEVRLAFAGTEEIGEEKIHLATEVDVLLSSGLPDGVAFLGEINKLSVPAIADIVSTLTATPNVLKNVSVPFFEVHDVKLGFASPGVSNEQLGLKADGFAFKGDFFFLGKNLGEVDGSGSTSGVKISGDIKDFDLSIVKFNKNYLNMQMGLTNVFEIDSSIEIAHIKQDVKVNLSPSHMEFDIKEHFGKFGEANLDVTMEGIDISSGKLKKDFGIAIVGILKSNLVPALKKDITKGLEKITKEATKRLKDLEKDLDNAQAEVNKLDIAIQRIKAKDKRDKQRATSKISNAQNKVNRLKKTHKKQRNKAKHCGNHWTHWACSGYWETRAAATYVAYKSANGVLEGVKRSVGAAFALDPALLSIQASKAIATAALLTAKASVEAAEEAEKFVLHQLENAVKGILNNIPFEVEEVIILGDLKESIENDAPLILDMKFKLFKKEYREYFALKLKDQKFNIASFALLPALAMDKATEAILVKLDPKVAQWFHSHIAIELANAEAKVRKEVEKIEHKYKKVLNSYEKGSLKFKQAYSKVDEHKTQIISEFKMTDMMAESQTFKNRYLAVGHSSLCLGVASNGKDVYQEGCKNIETERWSAVSTKDGYVHLKSKGFCLKAKTKENKHSSPLILAKCSKTDDHEKWKVISTDGFYDMIVNKYSQKCLHFDSESASAKTAYAVWTSCIGLDSQNFRDIKDAERPTLHDVKDEIKTEHNMCLSTKKKFDSYFDKKTSYGHLSITAKDAHTMRKNKDNYLISKDCKDNNEEERFSFVEKVNGDIKLIHSETGWCVAPQYKKNLILTPCDKGQDLFWRNNIKNKDLFEMKNVHFKTCISLKDKNKGYFDAKLEKCNKKEEQLIKFKKN